jgi:hypothetical protein
MAGPEQEEPVGVSDQRTMRVGKSPVQWLGFSRSCIGGRWLCLFGLCFSGLCLAGFCFLGMSFLELSFLDKGSPGLESPGARSPGGDHSRRSPLGLRLFPLAFADLTPLRPCLTVHGPNDGEPLNNSVEFTVDSTRQKVCYVLVYHGNRFVTVAPVPAANATQVGSTPIQFDTTKFLNGRLTLTFYLWDESMNNLYSTVMWNGWVDNPVLAQDPPGNSLTHLQLRGRSNDIGFILAVGQDSSELMVPPTGKTHSPLVRVIGIGFYTTHLGDGTPATDYVLNLDDMIRAQTRSGLVVLWSVDSRGQWAYSKLVTVQNIAEGMLPPSRPVFDDGSRIVQPRR